MSKQVLEEGPRKFDLKFLIAGEPKSGKTHFYGTYTRGPIHVYMFDVGGEITLHRLNKNRPKGCEITIDRIPPNESYNTYWKMIQRDAKDGFFAEMAERNGLVVMADSLTAAADLLLKYVAKTNGRNLLQYSKETAMRSQDWGQLHRWLKELSNITLELPCAACMTSHIKSVTNEEGGIIGRYPSIPSGYKENIGGDFLDMYMIERSKRGTQVSLCRKGQFQAGSRFMTEDKMDNPTLDMVYDKYMGI